MVRHSKFILESLDRLLEQKMLRTISPVEAFNDDPKIFHYHLLARTTNEITDGKIREIHSSGVSLFSRKIALFKCLAEALERLSVSIYSKKKLLNKTYHELLSNNHIVFDPSSIIKAKKYRDKQFNWIQGKDIFWGNEIFFPAQLVFLNYKYDKEIVLSPEVNTTGCAGGFDHEDTLLRGIYELIERDAYLAIFIAMLTPKQIDLKTISHPEINYAIQLCKRYYLDIYTFDITNDLQIPTFMTLIIDKTGLGQAFTTGLKSNLDPSSALIGSIEEALNTRSWYRKKIYENNKHTVNYLRPLEIDSHNKRAFFWSSVQQLKKLSFLFSSKQVSWQYPKFNKSPNKQLEYLKKIFIKKKFSSYYVNVTSPIIAPTNYRTYRVFIPQLQPFYIKESAKRIYSDRIQQVARHFGKENLVFNTQPHFFI